MSNMGFSLKNKGFTLIELLVVISIIGTLASVILASLNSARTKAKDAAHISNVKQIKTALELYILDNNQYPPAGSVSISNLETPLVNGGYIADIPQTVIDSGDRYYRGAGSTRYGIRVYLEDGTNCKTGVDVATSWWGSGVPLCDF